MHKSESTTLHLGIESDLSLTQIQMDPELDIITEQSHRHDSSQPEPIEHQPSRLSEPLLYIFSGIKKPANGWFFS
jgi:hypothetical protein